MRALFNLMPLVGLLVGPWIFVRYAGLRSPFSPAAAGRIGITLLFVVTGCAHFTMTDGMVTMLPAWVPARPMLVYATGVLEIGAGLAVLVPSLRRAVGLLLIVMLALFLPFNVYAAAHRVGPGGHVLGPPYLLLRVPLQLLFLVWVWAFAFVPQEDTEPGSPPR